MLVNLFSKEADEYTRYWISVSTEKTDKNGKGTGDYISASITCRLSKKAAETFEECAEKTKNKKISMARVKLTDWWFKAVEPKEGEPFTIIFINAMKEVEE